MDASHELWGLGSIGYPFDIHIKPKSRETSFAHNLFVNYPIVLKCCPEHSNDSVMRWL